MPRPPPRPTLFPYTTLFRSLASRFENRELRRQCPGCGKVVKLHDALCTRCGTELEFPDVELDRSEEHTSELQSHHDLVCRLLLEKKKKNKKTQIINRIC